MNRFEGVNVLLTGGASGLGRATVLRLVEEGASVFAVDQDDEGLDETAALAGGRVVTAVLDVTDEQSVGSAVSEARDALGGIDVLITVAGCHRTTPIETLAVTDLHELFDVNLVGTALFCREVVPHLPDGSGVIVNVASSAASHGNPYMTAYAASKGAVLGFSLSLAAELADRGIRVVPVSPGQVNTPLTQAVARAPLTGLDFSYFDRIRSPWGPATAEQVAGTIVFAASRDAAYLTGVDLRADGGSHI